MTRRYVAERRKRNREIAAVDASRRCAECKRDLSEVDVITVDVLIAGKFCSDACLEQHRERVNR